MIYQSTNGLVITLAISSSYNDFTSDAESHSENDENEIENDGITCGTYFNRTKPSQKCGINHINDVLGN